MFVSDAFLRVQLCIWKKMRWIEGWTCQLRERLDLRIFCRLPKAVRWYSSLGLERGSNKQCSSASTVCNCQLSSSDRSPFSYCLAFITLLPPLAVFLLFYPSVIFPFSRFSFSRCFKLIFSLDFFRSFPLFPVCFSHVVSIVSSLFILFLNVYVSRANIVFCKQIIIGHWQ